MRVADRQTDDCSQHAVRGKLVVLEGPGAGRTSGDICSEASERIRAVEAGTERRRRPETCRGSMGRRYNI